MSTLEFIEYLIQRFKIEQQKRDRSGIYGFTQRLMAYNSNKIEGSTLTEEQTASLFDTGTLPRPLHSSTLVSYQRQMITIVQKMLKK